MWKESAPPGFGCLVAAAAAGLCAGADAAAEAAPEAVAACVGALDVAACLPPLLLPPPQATSTAVPPPQTSTLRRESRRATAYRDHTSLRSSIGCLHSSLPEIALPIRAPCGPVRHAATAGSRIS